MLHEAKEDETTRTLTFAAHPWLAVPKNKEGKSGIYIRPCYPAMYTLCKQFMWDPANTNMIISGSPGIGKVGSLQTRALRALCCRFSHSRHFDVRCSRVSFCMCCTAVL
jgi:hypothetical protein